MSEPNVWSRDALLAKAIRYAEQMSNESHDEWRFPFWASLALEQLARAALAHVSPALLADKSNPLNTLYALGIPPIESRFSPKSIGIVAVFDILAKVNPDILSDDILKSCKKLMEYRNEDLHSGGTPFDSLGQTEWLPKFYKACKVILQGMDEDLNCLFENKTAETAELIISAAEDESAKSVRKLVNEHKKNWDNLEANIREEKTKEAKNYARRDRGHVVPCPSCNTPAIVNGPAISAPVAVVDPVTNKIKEKQTFLPNEFECFACGLKFSGLAKLHALDISSSYTGSIEWDKYDYFDPWGGIEPDFNE